MGSRDKRQKETKKPKKDSKNVNVTSVMSPPPAIVEVIKKGKKAREE